MSSLDEEMTVISMLNMWRRARSLVDHLVSDSRGVAATEFAMIVPLMLVMFFGTVEFSSGVAVDRKVTLVARTLSDLTSQSTTVSDVDLGNFGQTGKAILTPYPTATLQSTITELYVDPATLKARVQWSRSLTIDGSGGVVLGASNHSPSDIITIPAALAVGDTYLIWSEVSYKYVPAVGYLMAKAGITLSDLTYTRPRQSICVMYGTTACTKL
jgi:Flp pilus assembly protein TadG